jgi:hypothetical protein
LNTPRQIPSGCQRFFSLCSFHIYYAAFFRTEHCLYCSSDAIRAVSIVITPRLIFQFQLQLVKPFEARQAGISRDGPHIQLHARDTWIGVAYQYLLWPGITSYLSRT